MTGLAQSLHHFFSDVSPENLPEFNGKLLPVQAQWETLDKSSERSPCAVAFLFIPPEKPGSPLRLLLTRRSMQVSSHKGQIAFAGGRKDPEDQSPAQTAAREAEEEIGLDRSSLTPLAQLPPLQAIDQSFVTPVIMVSRASGREDFRINPSEVESLLMVEWPALTSEHCTTFRYPFQGGFRQSCLYEYQSNRIWGLTAQMINQAGFR